MIPDKKFTLGDIEKINTFASILGLLRSEMTAKQVQDAIAGLQGVNIDELIAAANLERLLHTIPHQEKNVELREVNLKLRESICELKEQNFALKEENTQLQKKIKEIAQSTLDDSIKNLKELKENL